ncbi:MAG: ATP-binding protein, partial [Candidatus Cloacimonadota bacterium]|nr:ATP-binding protein [Candidatus Cloacimonadota bacterium]
MSGNFLNIQPSPSALVQSLRDIGYSMESAIADVIDNSITAEAKNIHVNFAWNDGNPWIAVSDDGHGMTSAELTDAMRLGSKSPLEERNHNDLGRFGLGLKTASFSQCRQLTLVSSKSGMLSCREWDLDLIKEDPASGWRLKVLVDPEMQQNKHIANLLPFIHHRGTIVLWRKLDRYDGLEKKINSLVERTRKHLEMIFHRFLLPSRGKKRINISLNNDHLVAFNPFNPLHPATQELPEQSIHVEGQSVKVQPYVLPHYNKISRDEYEKYSGAGGYLQNQGFYVYRNRRLIIKGTWFRLIKKEELTKLLRVQIDIPNSLDHLWKIDVKKSHASPP